MRVLLESELQPLVDNVASILGVKAAEYALIQFDALTSDMTGALQNVLRSGGINLEDYHRGWTEAVQVYAQFVTIRRSNANITIRSIPSPQGSPVNLGVAFVQGGSTILARTLTQSHPREKQFVRIRRRL